MSDEKTGAASEDEYTTCACGHSMRSGEQDVWCKKHADDRVAEAVREGRDELETAVAATRRDQMEADCKAMCPDCNEGKPVERRDGEWQHEWEPGIPKYFQVCGAAAIRSQQTDADAGGATTEGEG